MKVGIVPKREGNPPKLKSTSLFFSSCSCFRALKQNIFGGGLYFLDISRSANFFFLEPPVPKTFLNSPQQDDFSWMIRVFR